MGDADAEDGYELAALAVAVVLVVVEPSEEEGDGVSFESEWRTKPWKSCWCDVEGIC